MLWAQHQFDQIPTFDDEPTGNFAAPIGGAAVPERRPAPLQLPEALAGVSTFLLFTTGSEDMTEEEAREYGITDYEARAGDGMTDSIILVVLDAEDRDLSLLSIPRDTWLDWRGARINGTYANQGVQAFTEDVTRVTGIPVNHVVKVNFTAAARLADVVGGIDMTIPTPMRDSKSHLYLPAAGCVHMDGRTTLEFSRSRHTQVWEDGRWSSDASASDFGRSSRQQAVISAALGKLLGPKLPLLLSELANTAQDTLVIDAGLDFGDLVGTARVLGTGPALDVHHLGLPSDPDMVGEAEVLRTSIYRAKPILEELVARVPGAELPPQYGAPSQPTSALSATPSPSTSAPTADGPSGAPTPVPSVSAASGDEKVEVRGFETGRNGTYSPCSDGVEPDPDASPS